MDRFDILKLRDLPIEGVAERLGLRVQKHKALCPFHDDSRPSLTFNVSKNTFKCYVCNAHGGVIDLAMHVLNKNFLETCQWLANEHNVILTEWQPAQKQPKHEYKLDVEWLGSLVKQPTLNTEAQDFLFAQRHYNKAVVRWLGISSISYPTPCWRYGRPYYDAPSLLIPYRDVEGNLLSVQSRYLGKTDDGLGGRDEEKKNSLNSQHSTLNTPRFRFPRGSKCHIFNLPILKLLKAGEPLYVSEGVTDCIALLSAGHKAIAIPSATLLNKDDIKLLKDFTEGKIEGTCYYELHKPSTLSSQPSTLNFHIYPDKDIPGEKLYIELLHVANQIGACVTRHSLPEGCKDFSDLWIRTFQTNHTSQTH